MSPHARLRIAAVAGLLCGAPWLHGCTTPPSARLAAEATPVTGVWVVVAPGSSSPAPGSMQHRLTETLRANGLLVTGYREITPPLRQLSELDSLWATQASIHAETSHVLVLTAQRTTIQNLVSTVEYEAVLWDTRSHRLSWKGAPGLSSYVGGGPANVESLAGEVLRALQQDGFIALPQGHPVRPDGQEIARQWRPLLRP